MSASQSQRPTTRALIGTMALVIFLTIYVFAAMLLAAAMLPSAGGLAQFLYYAVAGLAWVPVAGAIVSWMYARRGSDRNG